MVMIGGVLMNFKKKVCIMTINGDNFGNRLQNFALQEVLKKQGFDVYTLIDACSKYDKKIKLNKIYMFFYHNVYQNIKKISTFKRSIYFRKFDKKNIKFSRFYVNNNPKCWSEKLINSFDYFVCGSDQIWNPYYLCNGEAHFLFYVPNAKKVAYAPSFGVYSIQQSRRKEYEKYLCNFEALSVRENVGKNIINELIGNNKVEVLVDPTLLLKKDEWALISKKPKKYDSLKGKKYILIYFLGKLSETRMKEISRVARENDCVIINLLDKKDPFYLCGPSEFLYLEMNAFLICTDSFHSSVFAFIFDKPFVIFDREQKNVENMNSRIETLLSNFKLQNRNYNNKNITTSNLNHDYSIAYSILEIERNKSINFLEKYLDLK